MIMFRRCGCMNHILHDYNIPKQCRLVSVSSAARATQDKDKLKISAGPPDKIQCDWIGPPDSDSNIRLFHFHVPAKETPSARDFREERQDTQTWNHDFWSKHNKNFFKAKEEFMQAKLKELGLATKDGNPQKLTAEELSLFYKNFLDDNYRLHVEYNKSWYRRNLSLLGQSLKTFVMDFFSKR